MDALRELRIRAVDQELALNWTLVEGGRVNPRLIRQKLDALLDERLSLAQPAAPGTLEMPPRLRARFQLKFRKLAT